MSSIFLSHSHKDKPFARTLSEQLQARGIRTWLDEAEMQVGDSLIDKISTAIQDFAYLGVILSPHSVESPWVHLEVRTALTEEIRQRRIKVLQEVRRLFISLLQSWRPSGDFTLHWSFWRRRHQAIARMCHYRKRTS